MSDYITLAGDAEVELIIKHSRFIAVARPLSGEEEAIAFINSIRSKHPSANHNVYAYRLREDNRTRYSDDGEPSKTAGLPVLSMLEGRKIVDAAVVVTRYFGGTLLGTGGLVRAYGDSAKAAIELAGVRSRVLCDVVQIETEYGLYDIICRVISDVGGEIKNSEYSDIVAINTILPCTDTQNLQEEIMRVSNGRIEARVVERVYI